MKLSNIKIDGLRFRGCFIFAFLLLPFTFLTVEAHTFHTSLTRMDYNAKDKLFEITIQLFVHDLSPVLEKRMKKRVDLEKTPELDKEILKYLGENFVLQNKNGETKKLEWVGKEFETDMIVVYVEIPFDESFEGLKLQNTIFFESFPEQTNLVVGLVGEKKTDMIFKSGDKFKEF